VRIAFAGRVANLAHDDHAGGAPVDAQGAAGADVVVDREDDMVGRVEAGFGLTAWLSQAASTSCST